MDHDILRPVSENKDNFDEFFFQDLKKWKSKMTKTKEIIIKSSLILILFTIFFILYIFYGLFLGLYIFLLILYLLKILGIRLNMPVELFTFNKKIRNYPVDIYIYPDLSILRLKYLKYNKDLDINSLAYSFIDEDFCSIFIIYTKYITSRNNLIHKRSMTIIISPVFPTWKKEDILEICEELKRIGAEDYSSIDKTNIHDVFNNF